MVGWFAGWLVGCSVDWLVGWLVGVVCFVVCFVAEQSSTLPRGREYSRPADYTLQPESRGTHKYWRVLQKHTTTSRKRLKLHLVHEALRMFVQDWNNRYQSCCRRNVVWHELVHCSKEGAVLSGKSVIAVGARCTDFSRKRIISGQGMRCAVRGIVLVSIQYVTCVCTWW